MKCSKEYLKLEAECARGVYYSKLVINNGIIAAFLGVGGLLYGVTEERRNMKLWKQRTHSK